MLNLAERKMQMIGNRFMRYIQSMSYLVVIEPIAPAHQKNITQLYIIHTYDNYEE